jgi:hypothetical protein
MRWNLQTKSACALAATALYFSAALALRSSYVPPAPPPGEKAVALRRPFGSFGAFGANVGLPELKAYADATDHDTNSPVLLYEDGRLLGPAHQTHGEIARLGQGRYDHWNGQMAFSSSDGTNPISNGRTYWAVLPRK